MLQNTAELLSKLAKEDYCYLTTKGRVTGRPHEIEIWFGTPGGSRIYLMAGDHRSDWVLNLLKDSHVTVRIGKYWFNGRAEPVKNIEEEANIRYLLAEKYNEFEQGRTLSEWAQAAFVVGIDLSLSESE